MPDVFDKAKRSEVMSRIRGRGNKATELALARIFRAHGITGWRRHQPVFGRPDFVFQPGRVAVFVDGCFWHGCPTHCKMPAGNAAFWRKKLLRNEARDVAVNRHLRNAGWRVVRIWECTLEKAVRRGEEERVLRKILLALGRKSRPSRTASRRAGVTAPQRISRAG